MFKEAKELVEKSKTIYIVGHKNPDGDAIGASFATHFALKKLGKISKVIMPSMSDTFNFLPNIDECIDRVLEDEYDLLICVDASNPERLACTEEDFKKAKKILVIDHHKIIKLYGDVNCVDTTMPASCELIYNFLVELDVEIDEKIATYLYTGIMTDTGSFNYETTKPSTHLIASKLLEIGVNFSYICKKLNNTMRESKLRLLAKTIDNMERYFDGKLIYSYIDNETLSKLGINDEDAEGMTNYLITVYGTQVAVYVREKSNGEKKVSMRSGKKIDVSKIAIAFGGGGHARAAGYTMNSDYEKAKNDLLDVIEVMLK